MTARLNAFITAHLRLATLIFVSTLLLPILAHVYNSTFTRMMADDYCYAHDTLTMGLWGALDYSYNNWSGTPTSTVGQGLVALLGPRANALAPGLYLILLWLVLTWVFDQAARLLRLPMAGVIGVGLSSLSLYGIVQGIPNVYQSLYWTSGSVVYTAPLILIFFHLGMIVYTIQNNLRGLRLLAVMLACGVLTFLIGGFTQTIAAMQTTLFGLVLLACGVVARWRDVRMAVVVGVSSLIGAVLGVVVAIIAPGNGVRQALHPLSQPLTRIVALTLENTAAFIAMQLAIFALIPILVCLCLSAIMAHQLQPLLVNKPIRFQTALRWMGLSAAIGLILIMAFLAPAAYGMGKMPASRAWVVPQTVLILVVVSWGAAIGLSLRRGKAELLFSTWAALAVVVLLVIGPLAATVETLSRTADLRTYAQEWDSRDQSIRRTVANGSREAAITPFSVDMATFANLDVVDETATGDYTVCMQNYYGLQSVKILARAVEKSD